MTKFLEHPVCCPQSLIKIAGTKFSQFRQPHHNRRSKVGSKANMESMNQIWFDSFWHTPWNNPKDIANGFERRWARTFTRSPPRSIVIKPIPLLRQATKSIIWTCPYFRKTCWQPVLWSAKMTLSVTCKASVKSKGLQQGCGIMKKYGNYEIKHFEPQYPFVQKKKPSHTKWPYVSKANRLFQQSRPVSHYGFQPQGRQLQLVGGND